MALCCLQIALLCISTQGDRLKVSLFASLYLSAVTPPCVPAGRHPTVCLPVQTFSDVIAWLRLARLLRLMPLLRSLAVLSLTGHYNR